MGTSLIARGAVMKNLFLGILVAIGANVAAHAADMPTKAPIGMGVSLDQKNPDKYIVSVTQSGLGLPEREYYLKADKQFSHRAIIVVHVTRVADSCGYGVPLMDYVGERPHQAASSSKRVRVHGPGAYADYQREHNAASIDRQPAGEHAE